MPDHHFQKTISCSRNQRPPLWAYVEAANFARRFCPEAKKYYQRKLARTNRMVASKSLAGKISKACYFIMKDQEVFKKEKLFG